MYTQDLINDEVVLVNSAGERSKPYPCTFAKDKVTIFEEGIDVREGEKVLRTLTHGVTESYTILHVDHGRAFHGIPARVRLEVRKDTSLRPTAEGRTTHVNISHSTGIQVGDYNTQQIVNSFSQLIQQIEGADAPPEQKAEAKARLLGFISHPLVNTALGAGATGLIELLK